MAKKKQYLIKVWYFLDSKDSKLTVRNAELARWKPFLGDALENVEVDET